MNGSLFLQKRGKRHMARLMKHFEDLVEPHLSGAKAAGDAERFKVIARDTLKELTNDGCDIIEAAEKGEEINGFAAEIRDRVNTGAAR